MATSVLPMDSISATYPRTIGMGETWGSPASRPSSTGEL